MFLVLLVTLILPLVIVSSNDIESTVHEVTTTKVAVIYL